MPRCQEAMKGDGICCFCHLFLFTGDLSIARSGGALPASDPKTIQWAEGCVGCLPKRPRPALVGGVKRVLLGERYAIRYIYQAEDE